MVKSASKENLFASSVENGSEWARWEEGRRLKFTILTAPWLGWSREGRARVPGSLSHADL